MLNTSTGAINVVKTTALMVFMLLLNTARPRDIKHIEKADSLPSIQLIYKYPTSIYNKDGKTMVGYTMDTICIFYSHPYILYRLPGVRDWTTDQRIKGTEPYFIRKSGDRYGHLIKNLTQSDKCQKFLADSFLNKNAMSTLSFDLPPDSVFRLIKSVKDRSKTLNYELYAARKQNQGLKPDSLCYYYDDRLKGFDYSLSTTIDSLKGSKLSGVRIVFKRRKDSPPRYFSWQLKETPLAETKGIQVLFYSLIMNLYR
jgi:hypothetical protein